MRLLAEEGNLELKKAILMKMLDSQPPTDEQTLSQIWRIIDDNQLDLNDDAMKKIDGFIANIANDRSRSGLSKKWDGKIYQIASKGNSGEYIRNKLLDSLKKDRDFDPKTVVSLVRQGLYNDLIEIFPSLDGEKKILLVSSLPSKETEKVPQGAFDIAWMALGDPGQSVSAKGLTYLSHNYPDELDFLRKTWKIGGAIADQKEKKRFFDFLWSHSYSKIGSMTIAEACEAAMESPTENYVERVIDRLEQDSDQRLANFSALLEAFSKSESEQNRFWVMREMKEVSYLQFAFRKPEELELFKKIFSTGLEDKSPAVRAAALESSLSLQRLDFPDEEMAEKIISSDLPRERQKEIKKNYGFWICRNWDNLTRDRDKRDEALSKIIRILNSTEDEELAKFASSRLDHPAPEENKYISELAKIAEKNPYRECRLEAMTHLSALDFSKDSAVTSVFLKNLGDKDAEIRWRAFMSIAHKCQKYNAEFREKNLGALKAAAGKEKNEKTKADMENMLRHSLDAFEKKN